MSNHKQRIDLIKVLVVSSVAFTATGSARAISTEFDEVYLARKVRRRLRRELLQILHSTRALDTSLAEFTSHYGHTVTRPSLGAYLVALTRVQPPLHGAFSTSDVTRYQSSIVAERNRYMHQAGQFPTGYAEVAFLLSEMHDCLTSAIGLE